MSLSVFELRRRRRQRASFSERVANGTMTKEELLNAPEWLRDFDEAEDAILAQPDENPEEELEQTRKMRLFLDGRVLTEDPVLLKLIVSKLPVPLVSAVIEQLIKELEEATVTAEAQEEEEEEEDSIASRLLKRRRKERGRHY